MKDYSSTPLAKKLGVGPGATLALLGAPDGFEDTLEPLPEGVTLRTAARGNLDVAVLFVHREARLRRRFPLVARHLPADGGLWVGWPKKSSGVDTDLDFGTVQGFGLEIGLVDNKSCALSDVYSGLRFVVRLDDRDDWPDGVLG